MANNWPIKTIAECAADEPYATQIGPFGKALMADEYIASGVPVLRGVNVNRGRFHDDDFVFVSEETADRLAKFESFAGDVLLVHKGTLGQIGLMPSRRKYPRYIMGNSMLRVRCDPSKLMPEYLYYWLSSSAGQHYLFSRISQVGVPQLQRPLTTLREAELPVPGIPEQEDIVEILGSLDDKIELNRRMNRTLEAMARAIFKAWFIDFEPVKSKAGDAMSFRGMPQHVFDQLPDQLSGSEFGPIPTGWGYVPIGDLVEVVGGGTPSTKNPEYWEGGEHPFCTPKDMSRLTSPVLLDTERHITQAGVDKISSGQLPVGTVMLSSRAPIGYLALAETPVSVNQGIIAMVTHDIPNTYVLLWTEANMEAIKARAGGSTFAEISKRNFRPIPALRPDDRTLEASGDITKPLFEMMVSNQRESGVLATIRDALLPKLISGKIRVPGEDGVNHAG